ncbi:MAG: sigma 54-interacting transcriptional regulator [Anaerovoracaceae bacterium]
MNKNKNAMDEKVLLNAMLNFINDAIVIVDINGYIWHMSKAYKEYLGVDDQVIGKHVTKVIENTRMHEVLVTQKEELGELQKIGNKNVIVSRIPIKNNGKVIGAFGRVLYKDISELRSLYEKVDSLKSERNFYKTKFNEMTIAEHSLEDIVSESFAMKQLKNVVMKISSNDSNVLILGESGTGKELFAHAIHKTSKRAAKPIVSLNCATIPAELMESELFGYDQGAFTGALKSGKIGLIEVANGGTLFLDEIGDLPLHMQAKLLRVLQEHEIRRVGGTEPIKVNVRIVAATNKNLEKMMIDGDFRDDLYYRLDVVTLKIPPLRERREDIRPLAENIIKKLNERKGMNVQKITNRAMEYLIKYDWPGNVRELENVLERASNFVSDEPIIRTANLPIKITGGVEVIEELSLKERMLNVEREIIVQTLLGEKGKKTATAKKLGISRTSLYEKMEKLNIDYDW